MAMKRSFRKSQLIAFDNVAAGHDGVLSDPSGELVVKPCKQSEIEFYESISTHPDFIPHVPTFLGKITLGTDTATAQAAGTLVLPDDTTLDIPAGSGIGTTAVIGKDWAPSNGNKIQTDLAIVLENVAHGYNKPNILDVKLGARLWDDEAPKSKRAKLDKVSSETTSGPLGFRIAGMRTYQGALANGHSDITPDGYKLYDKMYGRTFSVKNVSEGFRDYFLLDKETKPRGPIRKIIKRFIEDLKELQDVIANGESRMYSASLLFVYEGKQDTLVDAFTNEKDIIESMGRQSSTTMGTEIGPYATVPNVIDRDDAEDEQPKFPPIQSLKLIDFAHAKWTPGAGPDENLLHGMRNVIKHLSEIIG